MWWTILAFNLILASYKYIFIFIYVYAYACTRILYLHHVTSGTCCFRLDHLDMQTLAPQVLCYLLPGKSGDFGLLPTGRRLKVNRTCPLYGRDLTCWFGRSGVDVWQQNLRNLSQLFELTKDKITQDPINMSSTFIAAARCWVVQGCNPFLGSIWGMRTKVSISHLT